MKYNPFQPGGIVAPGMFAGRLAEIEAIEQSLFQTKNENPSHFLIQGERGIGKSSLFYWIEITASGQVAFSDGKNLKFLTVSIDLNGCASQLDIVRAVGRGLRREMASRQAIREKALQVWEFLKGWEVLGVSYEDKSGGDALEDARDSLVDRIVELSAKAGDDIDGILILIDEADSPDAGSDLGEFVKLLTERVTRRNCRRLLIGMAALPSILGILKASHESSPRMFQIYSLQPLEPSEREYVVKKGLKEAEERNGFKTDITPEALRLICELSEGYPHFLQQFSFSAFAHDTDNIIDVDDVTGGAFSENGALAQLGIKYFNEMYHARINSEDYRRVLDVMANYGDSWVSRAVLIKETPVSEHNVGNALAALKEKNIILTEEGRRGLYRLPTKSFAAWINAIKAARETGSILAGSPFETK